MTEPIPLIRRADLADAGALALLAENTFRETFAAFNTTEDMEAHVAMSYSPELQAVELADPTVTTLVAVGPGGALAAYAQIRQAPAPEFVPGERPIELWRFYVDRPHHGRGLADRLMDAAIAEAVAAGGATLWLGVWEHNGRALAFYRRRGFVDVGTKLYIVGQDRQIDRVMARPIGEG